MKLEILQELTRAMAAEGSDAQAVMEALLRERGLEPGSVYQELEMSSALADTHRDISWSNEHLQLHSQPKHMKSRMCYQEEPLCSQED